MEIENLNHMTRLELSSTLKTLEPESQAAQSLVELMAGIPLHHGPEPGEDIFNIELTPQLIEDISFAIEQYTYGLAEDYTAAMDDGGALDSERVSFFYWQALNEKWGYLEVMSG